MEFKDLVTLYFERSNAMQTFWNFHITIALALLAFFGSTKLSDRRLIAVVLSISFVAFAAVNLDALVDVTRARLAVKHLIVDAKFEKPPSQEIRQQIEQVVAPPTLAWVVATHLLGDIFT